MEFQPLRVTIFTSRSRKMASSAFILVQKSNDDQWCWYGEYLLDFVRWLTHLELFQWFSHFTVFYLNNASLGAVNVSHILKIDA